MTNEQVKVEFDAIVGSQANLMVAHRLAGLMDLVNEFEPWPDDEAPKLVGRLWT